MKPDLSNKTDSTAAVLITAAVLCLSAHSSTAAYPSAPEIRKSSLVVALEDYAVAPLSSRTLLEYPPRLNPAGPLARINFLRQEAVLQGMPHQRFFVCDLNRNLYILDPTQREFVPYINFEEVFGRFDNNPGYAGGLVTFAFDPDYASNGRFFTSHTEDPLKPGPVIITNGSLPGLSLAAYSASPSVDPPVGDVVRHAVVIEWTDLNVSNSSFEGTAREILRIGFSGNVHPVGDMLFNPTARRGDPDWGNLYIACGDGGAGESPDERHHLPQRLDALQGKILRITPDLGLRPDDLLSANGRYRIPSANLDQNPFLNRVSGNFRPEIYALGFRNPHRLAWSPELGGLLTSDIGLNSWRRSTWCAKPTTMDMRRERGRSSCSSAEMCMAGQEVRSASPFQKLMTNFGCLDSISLSSPATRCCATAIGMVMRSLEGLCTGAQPSRRSRASSFSPTSPPGAFSSATCAP